METVETSHGVQLVVSECSCSFALKSLRMGSAPPNLRSLHRPFIGFQTKFLIRFHLEGIFKESSSDGNALSLRKLPSSARSGTRSPESRD